jgi:hypothetical protein
MVMKFFIVVGVDISTRKHLLDVRKELGINRHHIFEMTMHWTILNHPDLAVAFNDLRLDFTNLLINKDTDIFLSAQDCFTRLDHAVRAKRIGSPGPAKGRLALLP